MIERQLDIATPEGQCTTFIVHPEREGPHPVILFLMDAPAIREELRDMARRLATTGYYVMLPNLYYRSGIMEIGEIPFTADDQHPKRKQMMELAASLTIPKVMSDCRAMLAFADSDPAAGKGKAGAVGYCMSGRYAIYAGVEFPDRMGACASFYGTRWVNDRPDSPYLAIGKAKAELYLAFAEFDRFVSDEHIEMVRQSLAASGAKAEVEFCPGVHHGFAFPERPAYDKDAAERHWERLDSLFRRNLQA